MIWLWDHSRHLIEGVQRFINFTARKEFIGANCRLLLSRIERYFKITASGSINETVSAQSYVPMGDPKLGEVIRHVDSNSNTRSLKGSLTEYKTSCAIVRKAMAKKSSARIERH